MEKQSSIQTEISASKSLYNRALIVQSFYPQLQLEGFSQCDDVRFAKSALLEFQTGKDIHCGEGGTTFRFICIRVSRQPGTYKIYAKKRLLERPQQGLISLLQSLNTSVTVKEDHFLLESRGWGDLSSISIDSTESSQYASALILSAWNLERDLNIQLTGDLVSEGYFQLTIELLKQLGMKIEGKVPSLVIPKKQHVQILSYRVESDVSSAFAIAAFGALNSGVRLKNFPFHSQQPDIVFLDILTKLGVRWNRVGEDLVVEPAQTLMPIRIDLFNSPDLFPVLSVLCSFADGESDLYNAPHLVAKESNRIFKTSELLNKAGISTKIKVDGMLIQGNSKRNQSSFKYDPDKDHRMVMAARCLMASGARIDILNRDVVDKSFPEFWSIVGE